MSKKSARKVCILMAVYNGAEFLRDQLDSIRNQTYDDFELLISDDCSSDSSLAILKEYAEKDSRIHIVFEGRHYGSAKKHFMALLNQYRSAYDYYFFCDQDDVWKPNKVEQELDAMVRAESETANDVPVLVCSDLAVVDKNLKVISDSFAEYCNLNPASTSFSRELVENSVTGCTVLINSKLAILATASINNDDIVMHDWWLALVAMGMGKFVYIPAATILYRQHTDNSVGAKGYNILPLIKEWKKMCVSLRSSIIQARAYEGMYGDSLASENRAQLHAYAQLRKHPRISRPYFLVKSHAWKTGFPRCAGELLAILFSSEI